MNSHDPRRRDLIYDVIERWQQEYGHSPSVRDIMERVGLTSTSAVHHQLVLMERDGVITRCGCGCQRPVLT
jgi:SOS-response transcriptional repressor LexA